MQLKMIATDLDGTLLKNDKSIDHETREYLIGFQKQGGRLVLITGRRVDEVYEYIEALKMLEFKSGYVVTCDGQYIWELSSNKREASEHLNGEDLTYILGKINQNNFTAVLYDEKKDLILANSYGYFKAAISWLYYKLIRRNKRVKFITLEKISDLQSIEKISFRNNKKSFDTLEYFGKVSDMLEGYCITLINNEKIELSNKAANKCEALKRIVEWNGIPTDSVLVLGDEGNDICMLKCFKLSYAMGNANEYVKQVARYQTDSNESQGVLKALKRYIG